MNEYGYANDATMKATHAILNTDLIFEIEKLWPDATAISPEEAAEAALYAIEYMGYGTEVDAWAVGQSMLQCWRSMAVLGSLTDDEMDTLMRSTRGWPG